MTEAALAPTVSLMSRRRASASSTQQAKAAASRGSDAALSETTQRSKSSGGTANSENVSESGNAARGEAKAGGGTPAIDQNHPDNLCRYPNKRCYDKRAVKNNGELHKFCDKHRDWANRYQRKLEQKLKEKRIQSQLRAFQAQQEQAQAQAQVQSQMTSVQGLRHSPINVGGALTSNSLVRPYPGLEAYGAALTGNTTLAQVQPAVVAPLSSGNGNLTQGEDEYEPYQQPVQLQSEDLDCLDLLFEQ